MSIFLLPLQLD